MTFINFLLGNMNLGQWLFSYLILPCFIFLFIRMVLSMKYWIYCACILLDYDTYCESCNKETDVTADDLMHGIIFALQLTNFDKNTMLPKEKYDILKESGLLDM